MDSGRNVGEIGPEANHLDYQEEDLAIVDFELDASHIEELSALNEHYSSLGTLAHL